MRLLTIACIFMWAGIAQAEEAFQAKAYEETANLASNASFEGDHDDDGVPDNWTAYSKPTDFTLATEGALHGTRCWRVAKSDAIPHSAARFTTRIDPNATTYTASMWLKVIASEAGEAVIYLEYLDKAQQRVAITRSTPASADAQWGRVVVKGNVPEGAVHVRMLAPYLTGPITVLCDAASLSNDASSTEAPAAIGGVTAKPSGQGSVELQWRSPLTHHEIEYRQGDAPKWTKILNVCETTFNVIQLAPSTNYEFRVTGFPDPFIDVMGNKVEGGDSVRSAPVKTQTLARANRIWEGLSLTPDQHITSFPDGQCYPCVESYGGFLWIVECQNYVVYLSKVDAQTYEVLWTKEIVPRAHPTRSVYQGIPDTEVVGDALYVMWNIQDTGNPEGYSITQSRQWLLRYDFAEERVGEPIEVSPVGEECGSWEGGIAFWRGKLWVMHMDVWLEGAKRRTKVILRTYENGQFSAPISYDTCPTVYPYGPSVNVWGDKMVLLYSDLAANEKRRGHEPLLYSIFDGQQFSEAVTIQNTGRSRYAKGVELDGRFLMLYKWNGPWPGFGYKYHDLALSVIEPGGHITTTSCVGDRKYNSSPGICRHGDRVVYAYGKFEHSYGNPQDPSLCQGSFIGAIELGRSSNEGMKAIP